jgi:molybdopterin-containing oxidoreductase family membrane subunit
MYHATFWDYSTLFGTLGLFAALLFLFVRFLPVISMTEMRVLVASGKGKS